MHYLWVNTNDARYKRCLGCGTERLRPEAAALAVAPVETPKPIQRYQVNGESVPEGRFRQLYGEMASNVAKVRADAAEMQRAEVQKWVDDCERAIIQTAATGAIDLEFASFLLDVSRGGTGRAGIEGSSPMATPIVNVSVEPTPVHVHNNIDARPPQGDLEIEHTKTGGLKLTRTPAKVSA